MQESGSIRHETHRVEDGQFRDTGGACEHDQRSRLDAILRSADNAPEPSSRATLDSFSRPATIGWEEGDMAATGALYVAVSAGKKWLLATAVVNPEPAQLRCLVKVMAMCLSPRKKVSHTVCDHGRASVFTPYGVQQQL